MGKATEAKRMMEGLSRREMLSVGCTVAGWGSFAAVVGTGAVETVSFFFPRVIYRPPSRFRIGAPESFLANGGSVDRHGVIRVDGRWKSAHRFFVVREPDRLYATSARCVHLGCTINWFSEQRIFKCPCHGSEYHSDGTNFAGPAPRPLDRLHIELTLDGEIAVDTSIVYGHQHFDRAGAFVALG